MNDYNGFDVYQEFAVIARKFHIPKKVIKEWTIIDHLMNLYASFAGEIYGQPADEIRDEIIELAIRNHPGTTLYVLKKNVPSVYDLEIIDFANKNIYHFPDVMPKIIEIYKNRKV